jgi:hypothetical protein
VRASKIHAWPLASPTAISLVGDHETQTADDDAAADDDDAMVASGLHPSSQS